MRVYILGTGGSIPTKERSLPSVGILREGEVILFDCGEGTQLQISKAKLGLGRLKKIFVSHLHGDHVTGIFGVLMSLAQNERREELQVFGPKGINKFITSIKECLDFHCDYKIKVVEVKEGKVCVESQYLIEAARVDHNTYTLAYALVERERPGKFFPEKAQALGVPVGPLFGELQRGKSVRLSNGRVVHPAEVLGKPRAGRKIVYAVDTRFNHRVVELAKGADLLIHEGMFDDGLKEKAAQRGHSTVKEAALVAKLAGVKQLILIHISPRYRDWRDELILKDAHQIFPNTILARDLMTFEIPLPK